jgi:dynein heavy chain, axonemal
MFRCFQIELTKTYDYTTFHEDLVNLYYKTGAKFEDTTFLFTDNQIVHEVFLEDINNILNSGSLFIFNININYVLAIHIL